MPSGHSGIKLRVSVSNNDLARPQSPSGTRHRINAPKSQSINVWRVGENKRAGGGGGGGGDIDLGQCVILFKANTLHF